MVVKTAMIHLTKVNSVPKRALRTVVVHRFAERCHMDRNVFVSKDIGEYKHRLPVSVTETKKALEIYCFKILFDFDMFYCNDIHDNLLK